VNKLLSLGIFILIVLIVYGTSTQLKNDGAAHLDYEDDSYSIGKRFPANAKVEHDTFGITHTKKTTNDLSPAKNDYKIFDQALESTPADESAVGEAPGVLVSPSTKTSNKKKTASSARRDQSVPQEIQDFVQAKTPATGSSSKSSGISSMVIPWASKPGTAAASTTTPAPTENYSAGTAKASTPVILRLKGKVIPLQNVITNLDRSWFERSINAYAAPVCTNPKIGVYRTSDLLKLGAAPLQELQLTVGADFNFPTLDSNIDTSKPQNYSLQVSGCDVYFSRILTDFIEDQNINLVSTFISFSQVSPVNIGPMDVSSANFKTLVGKLESKSSSLNSYEDIYNELNSSGLASLFNNAFQGSEPDTLKSALPMITAVAVPNSFDEEVAQNLTVQASHWSQDYTVGVQWFVDGVAKGFGSNWSWAPDANSTSTAVIKVLVGKKKDLLNEIDTTSPYHQLTFNRTVVNTVQPQPPALALVSTVPSVSSTPHLDLELTTGAELANGTYTNCRSFAYLAITETAVSPDSSGFNILCSAENTQSLTYSLNAANRADGAKDLYLWAKDDLGNISSVPTVLHLYLDQTAPVMSFSTLAAQYGGGETLTLSWQATDHTVANTQNFALEYFDGTLWTSMPDVALMNGPLTSQLFSTNFTFPDADLTSTKFRVTAVDLLGHSSTVESSVFNIQRAVLTSTPTTYNFGDIAAGANSSPTTITFTNTSSWASGLCLAPALSGDTAQFTILSQNCSGSSLAASGTCQISVRANPALRQAYTADITLACGNSSVISSVMVTGGNNPPVLGATSAQSLNEDVALNFSLTAATDSDGDTLTYVIVSAPAHGTLLNCLGGTGDISCSYTPDLNYNGTDSLSYRAYDGSNYSATQVVSFTINPVNDAPTLGATQSLAASEETLVNFNLNAGADIENNTLSYVVTTSPANGVLSCTGGISRACSYTGNANFVGTDTFQYKVNDGLLDSTLATVTITVSDVNDAPVSALDYNLAVDEDVPKNFTLTAGTDIDLPGQTLTYTLVSGPAHGALSGCIESAPSTDRTCTFTPTADYVGNDSFSYKVCDPDVCSSNVTTVSVVISPINDAPVMIANQSFTLDDTQYIDITLNGATDIDVPADTLSYKLTGAVSQGTLTGCIGTGSWGTGIICRYTPPANYNGTATFTYKAYDGALESVGTSTVTFNINDKTPSPVPVITLASAAITKLSTASVTNTSCTDIAGLYTSVNSGTPAAADAGWVGCATSAGYLNTALTTFNGIQRVYVWSKDAYGNVSASSYVEVVFDNLAPALAFTNLHNLKGGITANISFKATELHATNTEPYYVRYHNGSSWSDWTVAGVSGSLNNQAFTTSINTPNADNVLLQLEVKHTDAVGNLGVATADIHTDLGIPVTDKLALNNGALSTNNNNVSINIEAHDVVSKVQYFCLKYNNATAPTEDDDCWKDVSAPSPGIPGASSITFNGYFFQIGFSKATYTVYSWVKDEAGQISVNSGTLGVDKYLIFYDPGTPPFVADIQVSNSDTPSNPVSTADMNAPSGSQVFIKWNVQDPEGLAANPITLEYTTNDTDFLPLEASQLQNGVNGGCSIDARFTGCMVSTAPVSTYFKIRVIAKDDADTTVFQNSVPMNDSKLRILAGNTEDGLYSSARSALFYMHSKGIHAPGHQKHKLVVSEDGKVFYLDARRGLLWVDPATGVLAPFIRNTGTTTGDNVHVDSATTWSVQAIALDAYNHLLIWDAYFIRRVNLSTMTIKTIIGGGAQNNPSVTINASDFALDTMHGAWGSLIPMPNGDILFNSPQGSINQRRYRAADNKIVTMVLQGVGYQDYPSDVWADHPSADFAVAYNTTTSEISAMLKSFYKSVVGDGFLDYAIIDPTSGNETTPYTGNGPHNTGLSRGSLSTGLDGKLYFVDRFRGGIYYFNPVDKTNTRVVGSGGLSTIPCADGTLNGSCNMDVDSFFVTKNSRIYFVDNGLIRTVDDSNKILTLFGQFNSYGNGEIGTTARFGNIVDIKMGKHSALNNKVLIHDGNSGELRELTIDSTLEFVTGMGWGGWSGPDRFEVEPTTGDFFLGAGDGIYRFNRIAQTYTRVAGGGSYHYTDPAGDGHIGTEINLNGYNRYLQGFVNGKLYYNKYHWVGYETGCVTTSYDMNDSYRKEHFLGNGSCQDHIFNLGQPMKPQTFNMGNVEAIVDPNDSVEKLFFNHIAWGTIYFKSPAGTLEQFRDLGYAFNSFTHNFAADGLNFYFCAYSGKLMKHNYNSGVSSVLSWPSTTLTCKATRSILYNAERNSIIFPFSQNGLDGVAEYKLD
jgi:hypothetical protein